MRQSQEKLAFWVMGFSVVLLMASGETYPDKKPGHQSSAVAGGGHPPDSGQRACSLEALTHGCALFPSRGKPIIKLSETEFVPNYSNTEPAAEGHLNSPERLGQSPLEIAIAASDEKIKARIAVELSAARRNLSQMLVEMGASPDFADFAVQAESNALSQVMRYLTRMQLNALSREQKKVLGEKKIIVPWPPEKPIVGETTVAKAAEALKTLFDKKPGALQEFLNKTREVEEKRLAIELKETPVVRALDPGGARVPSNLKKRKKVEDLFKYAQKKLVSMVHSRLENGADEASVDALLSKVKTVELASDAESSEEPGCSSLSQAPYAFYSSFQHKIILCKMIYDLPVEQALQLIAHELGHSIDNCQAQVPLYQLDAGNKKKWAEVKKACSEPACLAEVREIEALWCRPSLQNYCNDALTLHISDEIRKQLLKSRVLLSQGKGVVPQKHPFHSVIGCLGSEEGGGFRTGSIRDLKSVVKNVVDYRAAMGRKPEGEQKLLTHALLSLPECVSLSGVTGTAREALADWFGTEVVGDYLEENKSLFKTPLEKLRPLALMASLYCEQKQRLEKRLRVGTPGSEDAQLSDDVRLLRQDHPPMVKRGEKILLRNPRIRKAIGCKEGERACA